MTNDRSGALVESLQRARFEIIPMKGVSQQISFLPPGATVTVTASPTKGIEPTLELAEQLQRESFHVVPHIAARQVAGVGQLREILARIDDLGLKEAFVIAGDAKEPAGPFDGAVALLRAMAEAGHSLHEVGVTGYPESHAFISDQATIQAMFAKVPYATYIVSQICYDPAVIRQWIGAVRQRGIELPIYIGLPGVVDRARLVRISLRVGLGDSMRFLRRQGGVATRLMGGYEPDELIDALAAEVGDGNARVAGWHLFTFNEVEKTEQWRQRMLTHYRGAQQA